MRDRTPQRAHRRIGTLSAIAVLTGGAACSASGGSGGQGADDPVAVADEGDGAALRSTLRLDDTLSPAALTQAIWNAEGATLPVATSWSGSCPPRVSPQARGTVVLLDVTEDTTHTVCTADARTYVIELTGSRSRPDLVVLRSPRQVRTVPVSGTAATSPGPGDPAAAEVTRDLPAYLEHRVVRSQRENKNVAVWLTGEHQIVVPRSIPGGGCAPAATVQLAADGTLEVTSDADLARNPDTTCSEPLIRYTVTVPSLIEAPTEVSVDGATYPVARD